MTLKTQVCLPLFAALLLAGCGGKSDKAPAGAGGAAGAAPPPPTVQVAKVKRESVDVFRDYTAELRSVQTVEIRTRVGGELDSVHFAEGSMVQQGQVLFQIDPEPYYADIRTAEANIAKAHAGVAQSQGRVLEARGALGQAEAQLQRARTQVNFQQSQAELARAEATLSAAEREVRRYAPLKAQGAIPGQQYDQAVDQRNIAKAARDALKAQLTNTRVSDQADVGVAQANVESARASLESAQAAVQASQADVMSAENALKTANLYLSYTTIKAPFTGFIGRLNLDRGTMIVQGNAVLATLNSANPLYAEFSVSEKEYLELSQGEGFASAPFHLTLTDGEKYPHTGEFVMTDNNVDAKTGTLLVRVRFDNPNYLLKPGGFGRISMQNHKVDDALTIPQKAVFSNQSLSSVYVVKADNSVEPRSVILGDRVKESFVIKDGLKEGETVIINGLQSVRPGITVDPQAGAPAAEKTTKV